MSLGSCTVIAWGIWGFIIPSCLGASIKYSLILFFIVSTKGLTTALTKLVKLVTTVLVS